MPYTFDHAAGDVRVTEMPLGYSGTGLVVALIRAFVRGGLASARVRDLAHAIVDAAGIDVRDHAAVAAVLLRWLQQNVRYIPLPVDDRGEVMQRIATAEWTLFVGREGECASLTVAYVAMARALGLDLMLRTVGSDPAFPRGFEHVYAMVRTPHGWLAADPSYPLELGQDPSGGRVHQDWAAY